MVRRGITAVAVLALVLASARPAEARRPRESAKRVTQVARLLDFTSEEVRERLGEDPEFRVLAWNAVEARESRQRSGRALLGTGIATLVVGVLVGGILAAAGRDALNHPERDAFGGCVGLSCNPADAEATYNAGIGLIAGLGAAGTAMIIPGAVILARVSDAEQHLIDHVNAEDAPPGAGAPQARATRAQFHVPPEPVPLDLEAPVE